MRRSKVLLVEDDEATRRQLEWALRDEFEILAAAGPAEALEIVGGQSPDVILLDLGLPPRPDDPEEGLRLLGDLRPRRGRGKVIVCTAYGERQHAVQSVSQGAYDFLTKPVDLDLLRLLVRRASWLSELEQEGVAETEAEDVEEMIGTSESIRRVFAAIRKVAAADVPVLITGESGTGKELTAKAIHERSQRKDGPFVAINCSAIPETLLESELFGHEKGAFTGALQQKKGKVEYAQGGTLFLDEVGEIPRPLQVKLLRFLEEHTIERVGGHPQITVDARIVAATNANLSQAIAEGSFREDLYYRLGAVYIHLPPLRERGEDLSLIARVFLKRVSDHMRKSVQGFTKEAIQAMQAYSWPGNVRELSNKIRRAVVMAEGSWVTPEDLDLAPVGAAQVAPLTSLKEARQRLEREILLQALARHQDNLSRVAEELGISRPTLYGLLRKHGVRGKARSGKPAVS